MNKLLLTFLGYVLLLPLFTADALGIGIDTFRDEVFRPDNLPVGRVIDAPPETKIIEIFQFASDLILFASGSVAVFMLVFGAVRMIFSFGNQESMDSGKNIVKWSVIGLLVVILAFALVQNVIDIIFNATI